VSRTLDYDAVTLCQMSKSVDKQFAARLRDAVEKKGVDPTKPTEVAKLLGTYKQKAQNWMRGVSVPELFQIFALADRLGVDARVLVTGKATTHSAELIVDHADLSEDALEIARAFEHMQPQTQERVREHVFVYAVMDSKFPWFRSGKPLSKNYSSFERWHEENYQTQLAFEAARLGKRK
jgi:hypothetical protein